MTSFIIGNWSRCIIKFYLK